MTMPEATMPEATIPVPAAPTSGLPGVVVPTTGVSGAASPAAAPGPADRLVRPARAWYFVHAVFVCTFVTPSLSAAAYAAAARRVPLPSRRFVQRLTMAFGVVNVVEFVLAYRAAKEAGMTRSARRWSLETLVVGFPVLFTQREVIRRAR